MTTEENVRIGEYIMALARGDMTALGSIFNLMGKIMSSVAKGRLHNFADAEDVVQDTLLTLARQAKRFRVNENAIGWILKILDNLALNAIRKSKLRGETELTSQVPNYQMSIEDYIIIKESLEKLSQKERLLIYYKYWCKLSLSDIGSILKKPKSTISSQIQKIEEKIKK